MDILYIHVGKSSFVKKDIDILESEHTVIEHYFNVQQKKQLPLSLLKQQLFLIRNMPKKNRIVIQFAGYHSLLPVLFSKLVGKKCYIVLGGTDTVSFPEIQYGCFYKKYLRSFTRLSIRYATKLFPVSETLVEYEYSYSKCKYPKQGYKTFVPNVKTPYEVIHNGYNPDRWKLQLEKEPNSFITVAADLGTRFGPKLKGIDLILEVSKSFLQCKFYILGGDKLNIDLPENVIPISNIPHSEIASFIGNKQFYLQLSMSEGFPNALCEAMLCGCTPIVSNVGAMPMIVDYNHDNILLTKNVSQLATLIQTNLTNYTTENQHRWRSIIVNNYSLIDRKKQLLKALSI